MKKILLFIIAIVLTTSCSSDDSATIGSGKFTFEGADYPIQYAWVYYDNGFGNPDPVVTGGMSFSFTDLIESGSEPRNEVYFRINTDSETPQVGTFDLSYIEKIATDVVYDSAMLVSQTIIVKSSDPEKQATGTVTINSVQHRSISMTFTLTRVDGKVITGSYNGPFSMTDLY